jgi:hypothetical protein
LRPYVLSFALPNPALLESLCLFTCWNDIQFRIVCRMDLCGFSQLLSKSSIVMSIRLAFKLWMTRTYSNTGLASQSGTLGSM